MRNKPGRDISLTPTGNVRSGTSPRTSNNPARDKGQCLLIPLSELRHWIMTLHSWGTSAAFSNKET